MTNYDNESDSSSVHVGVGPYDDVLMDEARRFRQIQDMKRTKLDDKFGSFVDKSPCFADDENPKIKLPQSLCGIDKVEITSQIHKLISKQKKTQFQATFFRDRCEELQQRIRQRWRKKVKILLAEQNIGRPM